MIFSKTDVLNFRLACMLNDFRPDVLQQYSKRELTAKTEMKDPVVGEERWQQWCVEVWLWGQYPSTIQYTVNGSSESPHVNYDRQANLTAKFYARWSLVTLIGPIRSTKT